MACACTTAAANGTNNETGNDNGDGVIFKGYEAYGVNTCLDGSKMFWGTLVQDATNDLVIVQSERAATKVILRLHPLSTDTIRDLGALNSPGPDPSHPADGRFVFGAYKPDSVFENDDNSTQQLGEVVVDGTLVVIDRSPLFSGSRLVEKAAFDQIKEMFSPHASDGSVLPHYAFDQLGITDPDQQKYILYKYLAAGNTVVVDGRDVIETYALLRSASTIDMEINLGTLFQNGYVLGKVDAVPCLPGVQTGQVFAIWRLYNPGTAERATLVQKIDMRKIADVHVWVTSVIHNPVDYVDPDKWSPEVCSQCRRTCAKLYIECLKASQHLTGPEAVKKYKACLDDARACYEKCLC